MKLFWSVNVENIITRIKEHDLINVFHGGSSNSFAKNGKQIRYKNAIIVVNGVVLWENYQICCI